MNISAVLERGYCDISKTVLIENAFKICIKNVITVSMYIGTTRKKHLSNM